MSSQKESNRLPDDASLNVFRSLQSRNFRLYWFGQMVSLMGTWVQQTAMSWLLYKLTGSVYMLGLIAFLGQGPAFFIAPFAGTLADRVNRHKILLLTQSFAMIQALLLAYLTLTHQVQVTHLLALGMMMGVIMGFETPFRQAFVVDMLDRSEDLSNAISLYSSLFNGARFIGPAIAGLAVASVGEGWCFFANGVSYIAVLMALLAMRLQKKNGLKAEIGYLESIREGFSYAYHFEPIRWLLLVVAVLSLVGLPYSVIMPAYAKDILHGGADTLGGLLGAAGAGALIGALWLAARPNVIGLGRFIAVSAIIFGLGLIAFSQLKMFWFPYAILVVTGFGMISTLSSCNILLQTLADDDKRGRVMSLYTMAFMGMAPFGSLLIGFSANHIGISATLLIGGIISILTGVFFASRLPALRVFVRPIYIQKGIYSSGT